ncbi:uncharacterized protein TM35_000231000, partial [Trypanosoma theileri]
IGVSFHHSAVPLVGPHVIPYQELKCWLFSFFFFCSGREHLGNVASEMNSLMLRWVKLIMVFTPFESSCQDLRCCAEKNIEIGISLFRQFALCIATSKRSVVEGPRNTSPFAILCGGLKRAFRIFFSSILRMN